MYVCIIDMARSENMTDAGNAFSFLQLQSQVRDKLLT